MICSTWLQVKSLVRHVLVTISALMLVAALTGCAALQKQTPEQREAEAAARGLLSRLTATNQNLNQSKGVGRIQLETGKTAAINARVVWAASVPAKLSVAVLASGLPVLKFASDGQHLYFIDMRNASSSFRKIRTSDPSLARLLSIPLRSSDIVFLLAGRLPVREHTRVRLTTSESGDRVLVLQRWWRVVQKIHVDEQRDEIRMVEFFDGQEQPAFRSVFEDFQTAASYRIPRNIRITGSSGAWLLLRVERFFPNAAVTPEMFILRPPDGDVSAATR